MGVRRAHLVGSIPAASAAEAMRLAVQRLGPDLGYLPDGETGAALAAMDRIKLLLAGQPAA